MTPEFFCYWLNGHVELNRDSQPDDEQWEIIKEHLALAMNKVTGYKIPQVPTVSPPLTTLPFPIPKLGDIQIPPNAPRLIC